VGVISDCGCFVLMWAFIYDCGHLYLTVGIFIYGYGRFVMMGAFIYYCGHFVLLYFVLFCRHL
jgi:hypothetical protein